MRIAFSALALLLLTVALNGCAGGGAAPSAGLPPGVVTPRVASPPAVTAGAPAARRTFGEISFLRDDTLRANLLKDTIVSQLEPSTATHTASDTGQPGLDRFPVRVTASTPFSLTVESPLVDRAVLRDAQGLARATARSHAPALVTLDAGDYTLDLHSAGTAADTVFVRPLFATALPGVIISPWPDAIIGVKTGVAAFVGDLASGPLNTPRQVSSWPEFVQLFGGIDPARPTAAQVYQFFTLGGQVAIITRVTPDPGGGAPTLADYDAALAALTRIAPAFDLLLVPDAARLNSPPDPQLAAHAVTSAQTLGALAILEVPAAITTPTDAVTWWATQPQLHSTWAAVYYGPLTVHSDGGTTITLGPGGTVAGFCAYVDGYAGVWLAPANSLPPCNIISAPTLTSAQMGPLNAANISPVIMLSIGPAVWGARTAAGVASTEFMYVQQRRLYLYITKSLNAGLEWMVFAPNTASTWSAIQTQVTNFLSGLWYQGGLYGDTASDAFTVLCGLGLSMTPTDILNNYIRVNIGYHDPLRHLVELNLVLQTQGI